MENSIRADAVPAAGGYSMTKVSKPWLRGAVSLAALVGLAAALVASPVAAFDPGGQEEGQEDRQEDG